MDAHGSKVSVGPAESWKLSALVFRDIFWYFLVDHLLIIGLNWLIKIVESLLMLFSVN